MSRKHKALELFSQGYNCTQSIVCAYCELFGYTRVQGASVASGFGFGTGGQRLTCGSVNSMVIVAGMKYGGFAPGDQEKTKILYDKVREMFERFKKVHKTVNCKELLETFHENGIREARPCVVFIDLICDIIEDVLDINQNIGGISF